MTMRTSDPHTLDRRIVQPKRLCLFCAEREALQHGDACEQCLELAARAAGGDTAARFALCALSDRNVLQSELAALEGAYASQEAAYRERLERRAVLSRLHPVGTGRPRKASQ